MCAIVVYDVWFKQSHDPSTGTFGRQLPLGKKQNKQFELFRAVMNILPPLKGKADPGVQSGLIVAAVPPQRNGDISLCLLIGPLSWMVVVVVVVAVAHCSSCAGNHPGVNPHDVSFSLTNVQLLGSHKTLQNRDKSTAGICVSLAFGS